MKKLVWEFLNRRSVLCLCNVRLPKLVTVGIVFCPPPQDLLHLFLIRSTPVLTGFIANPEKLLALDWCNAATRSSRTCSSLYFM